MIPCKGVTEMLNSNREKEIKTQIWSVDLLSFRSLNQESVDTLQTARTSSLVDGRLAHIVLSNDKGLQLHPEKHDCAQELRQNHKAYGFHVLNIYLWVGF